jgi:ADP-ribose pyrophosphatase
MKLTDHYKERCRKKVREYKGGAIGFRTDEVLVPGGKIARREYITHPGAAAVLAIDLKGRIILVKQYRYPIAEFTYEIPAGKLAKGEDPLACVKRELEEEAGVRAKRISKIVSYWPTAAFSQEIIHLYIAHDLVETQVNPDEDEFLELVRYSPKRVEAMIRRGAIRDSKTLIAFLAWKSRLKRF